VIARFVLAKARDAATEIMLRRCLTRKGGDYHDS